MWFDEWKDLMLDYTEKSERRLKEVQFTVCKKNNTVYHTRPCWGTLCSVTKTHCGGKARAIGDFHTHPKFGNCQPSWEDLQFSDMMGVKHICIGAVMRDPRRTLVRCGTLNSKEIDRYAWGWEDAKKKMTKLIREFRGSA